MKKLEIFQDYTNKNNTYIASYKNQEVHNIYADNYADAIIEACSIFGLDIYKTYIEILDLLNNSDYMNSDNISLEYGFFHIEFNNEKSIQCCLKEGKKGFIKEISASDTGASWGICGDVNSWFGDYEICEKILLQEARKQGVRIK
jgi:hypothetical protein